VRTQMRIQIPGRREFVHLPRWRQGGIFDRPAARSLISGHPRSAQMPGEA
jgi:hypothetical protein